MSPALSLFNELEKIALANPGMGIMGRAAEHVGGLVRQGWHSQGSNFWKGVAALGTSAQLPGALREDDASGQNRSRTERVMGLAGDTLGGLAGMGVGARHLPTSGMKGFLAQGVAATAGSVLGQKAATLPFAIARHSQQTQQLRAQARAKAQAAATFPRDDGGSQNAMPAISLPPNESGISP